MLYDGYDYLIKCLVIGDSGTGKSSLMLRFTNDVYNPNYISTIGVDFKIKSLNIKNKVVKFQIWDTAGQDRFRTITSSYYRGCNAVIICYDITEKETFTNVKIWLNEVKKYSMTEPLMILCGTKTDLLDKRQVSEDEGLSYAKNNNMMFYETSSKDNLYIKEIFEMIGEKKINTFDQIYVDTSIYNKCDLRQRKNTKISLEETKINQSKPSCC